MKVIKQDILKIKHGIIGHQVNCQGKMGAGLALKIAKKWPKAKERYLNAIVANQLAGRSSMGTMAYGVVDGTQQSPLIVAHLFGQDYYGRNKQHTDYSALGCALHRLHHMSTARELTVYLPYGLGCGLAGGDWLEVTRLIESECPNAIICKHN